MYIWVSLAPAGVLVAAAGLIFDERKWPSGLALVLSLLTCLMILGIGD